MPVRKQHVVSQFLLKKWADAGGNLIVHRVDNGYIRTVGPKGVGRIDHFVQLDLSDEAERQWQQIETRASTAIKQVIASEQPPDKSDAAALRDLLALHLLRSSDTHEQWVAALRTNGHVAEVLDIMNNPVVLQRLIYELCGIHAAGPELLLAERRRQLDKLDRQIGVGGTGFLEATVANLERLRGYLNHYSIQIGWTEPSKHLLIGDTPAVTFDHDTARLGLRNGVTID